MQGVTKNEFEMMRIINGYEQGFNPTGLVDYIQSLDEEGTKEARNLIDEIEKEFTTMSCVSSKTNTMTAGGRKVFQK